MTDKHVRQQAREFIATALQGIEGFGDKVFPGRVHAIPAKDLPAMVVKSEDELIERAVAKGNQPSIQKRHVETVVYVLTRTSTGNIEDTIDDLAILVEKAIFADPSLGGIASETVLTSIQPMTGQEPDGPTGVHRMAFVSCILTKEGLPHIAL